MRGAHADAAQAARRRPLTPSLLPPTLRDPSRARLFRHLVLTIAVFAVAIIWVRLAVRPSSDLLNHREFGRRFIEGTFLYEEGLNYPYLPTWAAAHAPLALVPAPLVSPLLLPFGVGALILTLVLLDRLSRSALPLDVTATWFVAAASVTLVSRFIIRDLLDGGGNLILTALSWAALLACLHRRWWVGGWLLGAAIALKLTATIYLIALIVRGRYRCAARALVCAAVLIALPAVRMGAQSYSAHVQRWAEGVSLGIASTDPSVGVLGPEPIGNLGIRAALGRLLVGHESSDSWREMSAWIAAAVAVGIATALFVMLWRGRQSVGSERSWPADIDDAVAWAVAGVLGLLISPITWRAHAVAILPAAYLLFRRWVAEGRLNAAGVVGLAAVAVPGLLLARGVAGETVSDWSDTWSLTTMALICLAFGTARWPTRH